MPQARYYSSTAVKTSITADITNSATVVPVASTSGFPTSFPYTVILEDGTANQEAITVTAASGGNLTAIRGVDGTSALPHSNGTPAGCGFTARDFSEPQAHIAATSGVHGVTGTLVGTSDAQTLSNKTLSSPVLNTPDIENGGTLTLPTGPDTLVARTSTDTLTNKTLTSPTINGATITGALAGSPTGLALDSTSSINGITGTQIAADHTTTANIGTPLAGTLASPLTSSGTAFTIALTAGTWIINVSGGQNNNGAGGGVLTATGAAGITLLGCTTAFSATPLTGSQTQSLSLNFRAVVATPGNVTIAATISGSGEILAGGYTGYTALKVA